ncbi:MAG: purine-nucleoside phosphorylase [Burkholderiales bacterium]|nr:purine-nucleoside phosphorylase [Burkholderiales bacterium]
MYNLNITAATQAAQLIQEKFNTILDTAIILGSGLGNFIEKVTILNSIPYNQIPELPPIDVLGHNARFSLAKLSNGKIILLLEGRFHYYEGFSPQLVTLPVVICHCLGIKHLIITNAAGGINSNFKVGDLMIINDQINLTGNNPLIGKNHHELGVRFPDMSEPFAPELINLVKQQAYKLDINLQHGVYLGVSGPNYETKAEVRAFSRLGADAVGMSTVYEVLVANYFKIKVLGISCITNMATGINNNISHDHNEVIAIAQIASSKFAQLTEAVVNELL